MAGPVFPQRDSRVIATPIDTVFVRPELFKIEKTPNPSVLFHLSCHGLSDSPSFQTHILIIKTPSASFQGGFNDGIKTLITVCRVVLPEKSREAYFQEAKRTP